MMACVVEMELPDIAAEIGCKVYVDLDRESPHISQWAWEYACRTMTKQLQHAVQQGLAGRR